MKYALLSILMLCLVPPALAQDEAMDAEDAQMTPTYIVGAHQCDMSGVDAVVALNRERALPILQALVDEGMLLSAGEAVHHWGDEYNMLTWMAGPDIPSTLAAWEEMNARYAEAHPDDSLFIETCPTHRDYFYTQEVFTTAGAPPMIEEGNEPTLAVSYYTCPYPMMGDIIDDYNERQQPIVRALVDEGMLGSEGLYTHAWGDEWNLVITRTAADLPSLLDALEAFGERFEAAHGEEAADLLEQHCSAHKDNIYAMTMVTN